MTSPQEHDVEIPVPRKRAAPGTVKLYVSSGVLSLISGIAAAKGSQWLGGGDDTQALRDARLRTSILDEVKATFVEKALADERWGRLGDTLDAQLRGIREELSTLREQTKPIAGMAVKVEMMERERGK